MPDDFTAFVASNGERIARACLEIAGNEQVAEAMRDELLAAVAGRWRRWPVGSRSDRALIRIRHLLRREARTQHVQVHHDALELRPSVRVRPGPFITEPDEAPEPGSESAQRLASMAWRRAGRARRARWTGIAAAGLVVLAVALLRPTPNPEPELPTEIPEGVTVLPDIDDLMQREWLGSGLPAYLTLGPSDVDRMPALTDAPLARAVLVVQASGSRLVVAGDESDNPGFLPPERRRFEHPMLRGARLVATSLSPDGTIVALPKDDALVLVDVRTGDVRTVEVGVISPAAAPVTWLDNTRLMVAGAGARVVNVVNNDVAAVDVDAVDVLSLRGYQSPRLLQLVGVPANPETAEGPHTIRSLLMFWRDMDAAGNVEPVAGAGQVGLRRIVTGPAWLSDWIGPGFAAPQLVVRACAPTTLLLPADVGPASAAAAAIDGNGNEIATLVATGDTRLDVLGVVSQEQALVVARVEGRSLLVAWNPYDGSLAAVTHLNADAQVSVADLLSQRCSWCPQRSSHDPAYVKAATPVSASPMTS